MFDRILLIRRSCRGGGTVPGEVTYCRAIAQIIVEEFCHSFVRGFFQSVAKEALSANQDFFVTILGELRLSNLSQRPQSLGGTSLWIGERPIQSRSLGPILPPKELGQHYYALALLLCGLCELSQP